MEPIREKFYEHYEHIDNGGYTFTLWKLYNADESDNCWYELEIKNSFYGYSTNTMVLYEKIDLKFIKTMADFFTTARHRMDIENI